MGPVLLTPVILTTRDNLPGNEPSVVVEEVLRVLEIARTT